MLAWTSGYWKASRTGSFLVRAFLSAHRENSRNPPRVDASVGVEVVEKTRGASSDVHENPRSSTERRNRRDAPTAADGAARTCERAQREGATGDTSIETARRASRTRTIRRSDHRLR